MITEKELETRIINAKEAVENLERRLELFEEVMGAGYNPESVGEFETSIIRLGAETTKLSAAYTNLIEKWSLLPYSAKKAWIDGIGAADD